MILRLSILGLIFKVLGIHASTGFGNFDSGNFAISSTESELLDLSTSSPGTAHPFGLVKLRSVDVLSPENRIILKSSSVLNYNNEIAEKVTYQVELYSEGARGLAVHFDNLENIIPGQLQLHLKSGSSQSVYIPSNFDNSSNGLLSQYVPGDSVILEWTGTEAEASKAHAHIDHLVHDSVGVSALQKSTLQSNVVFPTYNIANQCTNDAICSQSDAYTDQRRSVAQYFFRYNLNVYATCSGVMLNSVPQKGAQYLLSAEQCIQFSRPSWLRESTVLFSYQRKRCNDYSERQPYYGDQVIGLEILTAAKNTDMVLFKVIERIPDEFNVYLAGWDARRRIYDNVLAFNYPLADVKKVVQMKGCLGPLVPFGQATYGSKVVNYDLPYFYQMIPTSGRSWAGSTGGPLFNTYGLVIGQLSQIVQKSSSNVCSTREFYGGFAPSYYNVGARSLKNFLNPDNFPENSLNGIYLADTRNNGLLKRGGALAINGGGKSDVSWECNGDFCVRKKKSKKKKSSKKSKKSKKDSDSSSSSSDNSSSTSSEDSSSKKKDKKGKK